MAQPWQSGQAFAMNFDLSDEQKMLAEQARALLAERSPYDHLRKLIDQGAEWDEPLWRELVTMGFLGANIPEEFGGLGMTALDLGVIARRSSGAPMRRCRFSRRLCCARMRSVWPGVMRRRRNG
ncbi:MAG: acyl-CoA dehydrogenase family protein [Sphingomonadaceae bacterium]|nr:acyl-CoA dehydrogenase family protein [Sphingomonadaceae bacterium]